MSVFIHQLSHMLAGRLWIGETISYILPYAT